MHSGRQLFPVKRPRKKPHNVADPDVFHENIRPAAVLGGNIHRNTFAASCRHRHRYRVEAHFAYGHKHSPEPYLHAGKREYRAVYELYAHLSLAVSEHGNMVILIFRTEHTHRHRQLSRQQKGQYDKRRQKQERNIALVKRPEKCGSRKQNKI